MSLLRKVFGFSLALAVSLSVASPALAATPQLSVTSEGSYLRVIVSGADSYAQVNLYTRDQGTTLWTVVTNFGTTDQSGYLSQVYGSSSSSAEFYVVVNGQQSSTVRAGGGTSPCTYSGCYSGNITFSPSSVLITIGQTMNVSIYSPTNIAISSYYISSNTNSYVASGYISGSSMNVTGLSNGSTTITVCTNVYSGSSYNCGNLYVTVSSGSGGSSLSLSQTSLNLASGQSAVVTAYSTTSGGAIYISSNSNSSVVSASISGNAITFYGNSSGSATVTVCGNSSSNCASVYVIVNGNATGQISFNPNNVSLTVGQSMAVTINTSYYSSFYISSNSNANVVSATMSGSVINLYANSSGSATILVCSSGGGVCGSLYVTVNGSGGNSSQLTLSQYSLSINSGQSSTVYVYAPSGYAAYVSSNSNSTVATASISGTILTVWANATGTTTIVVCASYASYQCASLYVTVNGSNGGGVTGSLMFDNGTLVNDNGTVYIIYKNTKRGFANYPAFRDFGFRWSMVAAASTSTLTNVGTISSAQTSHPSGSWVQNGGTVYFVHDQGLIPIPTWDIFLNNGGDPALIVRANMYDTGRPMLSAMTWNDSRLQLGTIVY